MLGVRGETIGNVDHRAGAVTRQRDAGHDLRGGVGPLLSVHRRNPQRNQHAERFGAFRGQIGERRAGGAESDLLEVEPIGTEVDVLEGVVDADGQGHRAERNQRAVVPELRHVAHDLCELREDPTDAVEFLTWAEIHRIAIYYNTSGASSSATTGGRAGSTSRHALQTSGRAASTSAGRRPRAVHCRAPRSPGRPSGWAHSAQPSAGAVARARKAPIKPASRSPPPPVASPGVPLPTTLPGPPRSALT